MRQIDRKTADEDHEAIIDKLAQHKNHVHTITTDNGKEFADHQEIADSLDAGFYFAYP